MEDNSQEQSNSRPWLYKKGQSGNPGGRKKGSISMKEWIRRKLLSMTPEQREIFLEGVPKEVIWKMAEGNPDSKLDTDVNIKVEKLGEIQKATKQLLNG